MNDQRQELREAVAAADDALASLQTAKDCLRSAGRWGFADILGGGMLSTLMKHNKMNQAERNLLEAKTKLCRFAKELADVNGVFDIHIRVDDFLGFADFFFDGAIADWLMQKRISDASAQVDEAVRRVSQIRSQLEQLL